MAVVRLAALIDNLKSAVLVVDERQRILVANERFCTFFDVPGTPEALVGVECRQLLAAGKALFLDPEAFEYGTEALIARREPVHGELLHLADGRVVERDYVPVFADGAYAGHFWNFRDVTPHHQSEQALQYRDAILEAASAAAAHLLHAASWEDGLQETLARLGKAVEISRVYIFENVTLPDGRLGASQRYEWTAAGIEPQIDNAGLQDVPYAHFMGRWREILESGRSIYGAVSSFPVDEAAFLEAQAIRSIAVVPIFAGKIWWGFIGLDECVRHRRWHKAEIDALEVVAHTLGAAIRRRRTEQDLARSEQRYRELVEQAADIILRLSPDRRFTYANPAALRTAGYTAEEMVGMAFREFISPSFGKDIDGFVERWLRDGRREDLHYELPIVARDGREIWLAVSMQVIREDGQLTGFQAIARDVTERKEAESVRRRYARDLEATKTALEEKTVQLTRTVRELRAARDETERALAARGAFLAMMSHEIRTPMNGILGFAELLGGTDLSAEQREFVGVIRRSGEGLLTLIDDILDYSKIDAGKLELEQRPFRLQEVLREAFDLLSPKASRKGLRMIQQVAPGVPDVIVGDEVRLRQILTNLLSNAVKFTEHGGVTVRVRVEERAEEHCTLSFSVEDTGIGIPADKRDRLFKPFSQIDASTTRHHGGTGLGLAICKLICERMGGAIEVESEAGSGSTFHFTVCVGALRPAPAPSPEPALAQSGPGGGLPGERHPLRILVAEDHPVNRMVVLRMLERAGYRAEVAESGAEAVEAVAERAAAGTPFDVILMDVRMPGMDGLEATRRIRAGQAEGEGPYIIALTANAMREDRVLCLAAGMNAYLSKPVSTEALYEAIEAARETA